MFEVIFATGEQIYTAAIAGAERGYNRSTDDHVKYEAMIKRHYKLMLSKVVNRAERRRIKKNTGNNWRKAYLPLKLALIHCHIGGKPCEAHARIFLTTDLRTVFDIPMDYFEGMKEQSKLLFD